MPVPVLEVVAGAPMAALYERFFEEVDPCVDTDASESTDCWRILREKGRCVAVEAPSSVSEVKLTASSAAPDGGERLDLLWIEGACRRLKLGKVDAEVDEGRLRAALLAFENVRRLEPSSYSEPLEPLPAVM
jgi:hypothetical protein